MCEKLVLVNLSSFMSWFVFVDGTDLTTTLILHGHGCWMVTIKDGKKKKLKVERCICVKK